MINTLARQLSIDIITDTPNHIIEWFNDIWSKLYIIETNVYHKNGGEIIVLWLCDVAEKTHTKL